MASAGHPPPLLASGNDMRFAMVPVGPPLGVGFNTYDSVTLTLPSGTVLFAYTDGLVERRDEDIDVGMDRLAAALAGMREEALEVLVAEVLARMNKDGHHADDIAVLALRRNAAVRTAGDSC